MNAGGQFRLAATGDAMAIATLAAELGYPTSADVMTERLHKLLADRHHLVAVATRTGDLVVGWIHAHLVQLIEADLRVEIGGLVIGAAHRRQGLGTALVSAAAQWGVEAGARCLTVRCNSNRPDAHRFYQRFGFTLTKEQLVFRHPLPTHVPLPSARRLSEL